jgi:hypothetical protein
VLAEAAQTINMGTPVVLLPDLRTAPVSSYRHVVRGLLEFRNKSNEDLHEPTIVVGVAATDEVESDERRSA